MEHFPLYAGIALFTVGCIGLAALVIHARLNAEPEAATDIQYEDGETK